MTRRPPVLLLVLALAAPVFAVTAAVAVPDMPDCGPGVEAVIVDGFALCTHGDDDPPAGVDTTALPATDELWEARYGEDAGPTAVAADAVASVAAADAGVACVGDGKDGPRVQLVYARAADTPGRFSSVVPLIRQYAADADNIVNVSAGRVGDGRRIRYVTNSDCKPAVMNMTLSNAGDDSFRNMIGELRTAGLTDPDRKYLVFMDAAVGICGLGEVYLNDTPGEENPNNSGRPMYARVDTACWQHAAAHELIHTLGAVQQSAPNATVAGHCTDEIDVMCYKDTATTVTRQVCTRAGQVDCNNNDYFHPNPKSGSYLDTKWNVARSRFLEGAAPPPPPAPTSITVPTSGIAGVPWPVKVSVASADASVVWSSTRPECSFADTSARETTWNCPATTTGGAEILVHVTENGATVPYSQEVAFEAASTRPTKLRRTVSSRRIKAGQTITVTAKLADAATGQPVIGVPVDVWALENGSSVWTQAGTVVTNLNGKAGVALKPRRNVTYMLRSHSTAAFAMDDSPTVSVKVASRVRGRLTRERIRADRTVAVKGSVSPDKQGRIIRLKQRRAGRWVTVAERRVRDDSTYVLKFTPRKSGDHRLRVVKPADALNVRGRRALSLEVR